MIYNGVMLSKKDVELLCKLFSKIVIDKTYFNWLHDQGLINLFYELKGTLDDPIDDHLDAYHHKHD